MKKVATWGTFDLLHDAHKEFLQKARELGDYLVVVVIPDSAVPSMKIREDIPIIIKRQEQLC